MTQYERIERHLKLMGYRGETYWNLNQLCHTNCSWKRISEMAKRGYVFRKTKLADGRVKVRLMARKA